MENVKVLVLEGGFNEEHEVSIETGKQVKKSLSDLNIEYKSLLVNPITFEKEIIKFKNNHLCFNALHGRFGEDGKIQKILDNLSFKYTHSNEEASSIGFNKILSKKAIKNTEVLTAKSITLDCKDLTQNIMIENYKNFGPFVIKPISSGSSFGVKIFKDEASIIDLFNNELDNLNIYKDHPKLLVEKFIEGRELTVAVVEKKNLSIPLEVTEIIYDNEYFDYKSKYTKGYSKHILPAVLPQNIYHNCKIFAKIVHDKIKCRGISRSDFIYDGDNIYFLEINTQPGLTAISLVPEQLRYKNVSFNEMITDIIKCSL